MAELIDETMNEIRRNWNVTLQDEINPIPIALELLQQSNPAHDFESFERLHGQLETSMEWIIENNYTGFNGAVSTFGGIVDSIKECKGLSSQIKGNLQEFRDQIQYKRTDLPELWAKIEKYKLKISALTTLAEMKVLRKDAKDLSKKRFFVPAARVLAGILAELGHVGAELDGVDRDFSRELREDKEAFLERLLEEFCQHAFLKVPASTSQLVAQALSTFPSLREFPNEFAREQQRQYLVVPEGDLVMVPSEFNYSPESNVQVYLFSLFQAAHCLGCLPDFCNTIEQRLSAELFQIAETDMRAVNRRFHRERDIKKGQSKGGEEDLLVFVPSPMISQHDQIEIESFAPFLRAFIDTLLVRFSVIISAFWTVSQHSFDEASADTLASLYEAAGKAVHQEIRNVLGTFLKGSKMALQLVQATTTTLSPDNPPSTFLFKMTINDDQDEDQRPTLGGTGALLTQREKFNARKFAKMLIVDQFSSAKEEFGHRPIVKASLQYLPLLFPSFSFFGACMAELGISHENLENADTQFLGRYMLEDFLPFLDTYVNQEMTIAFNSLECMVGERVRAEKPEIVLIQGKQAFDIPRCFKAFLNVFNLLIKLSTHISDHRGSFENLLKSACGSFLDRLNGLFQVLTKARGNDEIVQLEPFFSARLALDQDLRELLKAHPLLIGEEQEEEEGGKDEETFTAENEAVLLEKIKGDRSLAKEEVILDHRRVDELALLQRGLELLPQIILSSDEIKWLVSFGGNNLRFNDDHSLSAGSFAFSSEFTTFLENFLHQIDEHAFTTLLILRLEMRAHSFYFIDLALREGSYNLEDPVEEPDSYITLLCNELIMLESILADWFPYAKKLFCVEGLSPTIQTILINGYRQVKDINENGYLKLQSTIKSLEQVMALIGPHSDQSDLDRVRAYYVLAQAGHKDLLENAQACEYRFTLNQYQAIVDSAFKADDMAEDGEEADADDASTARRREYQNQLVRLQYLNN